MSKPGADGSMQDSLIGLWHLEQARTPISARLIGMDGWHDARLGSGGSATLSVTGKGLYGTVMETVCSSGFRSRWSILVSF
jgi:hypothetical protein